MLWATSCQLSAVLKTNIQQVHAGVPLQVHDVQKVVFSLALFQGMLPDEIGYCGLSTSTTTFLHHYLSLGVDQVDCMLQRSYERYMVPGCMLQGSSSPGLGTVRKISLKDKNLSGNRRDQVICLRISFFLSLLFLSQSGSCTLVR